MRQRSELSLGLSHRVFATWALLVYIASLAGGWFHLSESKHQLCADHGTIEHMDGAVLDEGQTGPDHQDGPSSTPDTPEHHDTCGVVMGLSAAAELESPCSLPLPQPQGFAEVDAPPHRTTQIARAQYRLAPKGSPPQV